jgi:hypothetical protein
MQLFEIGERVERGQRFTLDLAEKKAFLELGSKNSEKYFQLPFGHSLSDVLFAHLPECECNLRLDQADIAETGLGLRLVKRQGRRTEGKALVRVEIPPGLGGTIYYSGLKLSEKGGYEPFPPSGTKLVGEGVFRDSTPWGEELCWPAYLLVMEHESGFRVVRTGDLQNAPSQVAVTWSKHEGLALTAAKDRPS